MGDNTIITESGKKIPELKLNASMNLDKNCILYGPTKTGKTVLVKYMMWLLLGHIDQILVFSPTEPSNRSYEGTVEAPLIHYKIWLPDPKHPKKDDGWKGSVRFLEAVLQRQEMQASIYSRANSLKTLAKLFARLPPNVRSQAQKHIKGIDVRRQQIISTLKEKFAGSMNAGILAQKKEDIDKKFKQMLALLYKKYIAPYHGKLKDLKSLDEDERWALAYLTFNPRMLLIFDDCAADLKPLFNKEVFRRIFYQGRHSFISAIVCVQDDTDIPANLRKNALLSIFTTSVVASSNFERKSNQFPKEHRLLVAESVAEIFSEQHRKLAYLREDDTGQHFYHLKVSVPKPFKFGSKALQDLCGAVGSSGVTMDESNPYYSKFKV